MHEKHKKMEHKEHKEHKGMIDNRMVKDNHQEGIERVKQRKGDMPMGQGGCMSGGWKHGKGMKEGHWSRSDSEMTPRKA